MQLCKRIAVSVNLSYSTAMLIYSTVEGELRMEPLPVMGKNAARKIAEFVE
jgi:hypothetical protein